MVRFENVGLRYSTGPQILRDISFTIEPGSFHFLTGVSGAGKSSLLQLIYLARQPTAGRVKVFKHDIAMTSRAQLPAIRRRIGVVFQDFRLLDHLSTMDNVALPLRIAGVDETQIQEQVSELLHWVGLADYLHAKPTTLSGGQQQRVAIARAVISRPRLLLADEPTGNLDDQIAVRLLYLFEELNRLGTTVIIATHNQALVDRFDHPQLALQDGALVESGDHTRRTA